MAVPEVENFRPVSDILTLERRDFPLADKTLADPSSATPLVDGEWVNLNSSEKVIRATTVGTPGDALTAGELAWPVWSERGRYDVQAMAERKVPLIWMGSWEFESLIFDAAATVGSGAAITAIMQPVKVATVTIGSRNYTGLVGHGGSGDSDLIVGYVTRLHTVNGGFLRIRGGFGF